jgi:hypothetical protein
VAEEAKTTWDTGVHAMRQSLDLASDGQPEEALRLLDGVIARANEEKRGMWVGTLCRHAAVLAHAIGDIRREIQYAEQALPHADNQRFASTTSRGCCCVLERLRVLNVMQKRRINWQWRRELRLIVIW